MADTAPALVQVDSALGEVAWPGEEQLTQQIAVAMRERLVALYPPDERPALRDVHLKAHGCVRGDFIVEPELDPVLARGVFIPGTTYKTWIRFSNGAPIRRPDQRPDARGMAIKLTGVPGEKLMPDEQQTQDFVLINHPVFFVDSPGRYLAFLEKLSRKNPLAALTAPSALEPHEARIAAEIASKRIANPLEERYWSTVPFRHGTDGTDVVKYSAVPCDDSPSELPRRPERDFLRDALTATLSEQEGCFAFLVQRRTRPDLSVEESTLAWDEATAPFVKVATLRIPPQTFDTPAQDQFCESLSFTPWHSLPDHRPLGGVNRIRRVVYTEIAATRREMNGASVQEPTGAERFE